MKIKTTLAGLLIAGTATILGCRGPSASEFENLKRQVNQQRLAQEQHTSHTADLTSQVANIESGTQSLRRYIRRTNASGSHGPHEPVIRDLTNSIVAVASSSITNYQRDLTRDAELRGDLRVERVNRLSQYNGLDQRITSIQRDFRASLQEAKDTLRSERRSSIATVNSSLDALGTRIDGDLSNLRSEIQTVRQEYERVTQQHQELTQRYEKVQQDLQFSQQPEIGNRLQTPNYTYRIALCYDLDNDPAAQDNVTLRTTLGYLDASTLDTAARINHIHFYIPRLVVSAVESVEKQGEFSTPITQQNKLQALSRQYRQITPLMISRLTPYLKDAQGNTLAPSQQLQTLLTNNHVDFYLRIERVPGSQQRK